MCIRDRRLSEIAVIHAGCDSDITRGKPGAEWMQGLIEAASIKVVANPFDHEEAKSKLFSLAKGPAQTCVVCRRFTAYGLHDRHQLASQLRKQRADRSRRHALVGIVNVRVGDMLVRSEEVCVFASKIDRCALFASADLRLSRIVETALPICVVEGVPA